VNKRIEGSGFGFADIGLLDGLFALLHTLSKEIADDFEAKVRDTVVWKVFVEKLKSLNSNSEISPRGLNSVLHFISGLVSYGQPKHLSMIAGDSELLKVVVCMLKEETLERIANWPSTREGGSAAVQTLVSNIISVLYLVLTTPYTDNISATVQTVMYKEEVVRHCIACLNYLGRETFVAPIDILSRLVLGSTHFARQYLKYGGLDSTLVRNLLDSSNNSKLVVNSLLIISQLARVAKDHYKAIHQANIYTQVKTLLKHSDPEVRSKVCNLIGNMCRHSHFFYGALEKYELLPELIERCQDKDQNTRKFACFAIGNACFHNENLYQYMKPCIPYLIKLLHDADDKTRANAAGALGNLVRNSGALVEELLRNDALGALVNVVSGGDGVSNAKKIALFSIGNFCVYEDCRSYMTKVGWDTQSQKFSQTFSSDPEMMKYLNRIHRFMNSNNNATSN
jgi:fused-like protein